MAEDSNNDAGKVTDPPVKTPGSGTDGPPVKNPDQGPDGPPVKNRDGDPTEKTDPPVVVLPAE
jgi:hypothetical protein